LEVDGGVHNFKNKDEIRTKELEEAGYRVFRFNNYEFNAQNVWREI
jgi:very-short-patch-repair endonuclease